MKRIAAGAAWLVTCATAQAASFPCTGRLTSVERQVCNDAEVSVLDEHLARYHAAARDVLGRAAACLVADQHVWLRTVRNACRDTACLKVAYLQRLSELDGLQPGATALKMPLPPGPTLVWIVPAAADLVAAPPLQGLQPLEVQGRLVNDVAGGDGYVVQSPSGLKHLVVASMFIDESTERLKTLAAEAGATYRVRGRLAPGAAAATDFAQGSCRYVYR